MTCTSSKTQNRRRFAAAFLALPLSLAMTGAAFATGTSASLAATSAELRTASANDSAAASSASARVASGDKAASHKTDDKAADDKAASHKPAEAKGPAGKSADSATTAQADKSTAGATAGAASGKGAAAAATTNTSYADGNTNSSKADRPKAPVSASKAPSQPLSNADKTGGGANPGTTCTHAYCSNNTGVEPGNGNDSAPAKGQPCAGCVGKADNKNPPGQASDGSDHNAGYECDRNQGVGKMNPAHTGCATTPTTPTTPATPTTPTQLCPDGSKMPAGGAKDCPKPPKTCPDGSAMPAGGDVKDCKKDAVGDKKVTICHATGSATNPYVLITISENALPAHRAHQDGRDIIPAPADGVCPGGPREEPKKVTICHATGSATNPYVVITISENALPAHGAHQDGRDIIPAPADGVCPGGTPLTDACPNLGGIQMPGADCNPTTTTTDACPDLAGQPMGTTCTTGGGGTPPVDVCPDVPGMQTMAPCTTNGGGAPIQGVTPNQPATGPVPVVGPPTVVPPGIVPNGTVTPIDGVITVPATRPVAARPSALPFTGTDAALLMELGALLLLAGGGVLVAARRERTARSAA